jgi:hypothetical protein
MYPRSRKLWRNASKFAAFNAIDVVSSMPMRQTLPGCCARAASANERGACRAVPGDHGEQHFAALIDLLKDETPQQAQRICNDFARRLTAALKTRLKKGAPSRKSTEAPPAATSDKDKVFKQAEDNINAALAGLFAAPKRKRKAKGVQS